ncbi:MAG: hypothetical protein EOP39_25815 [Rubrivivax sp.]|nr:MAG: hypothetical protein EOP39_25815 [Rubrivivax sp.]
MSKLERQWWFWVPVSVVGVALALVLFRSAGFTVDDSPAAVVVFALTAGTLHRLVSFLLWLAFLAVSPRLARQA